MNAKQENKQLKQMYDKLMDYEKMLHQQNQRRIKIGIKCIFIIPALFLFLLFVTEGAGSKIIFLVLWITSLFCIAIYLIGVEYVDFKLQEKMHEIHGDKDTSIDGLIDIEEVEKRVNYAVERIDKHELRDKGEKTE